MQDTTAKLADCETRMRRWHTRLTRASNMLQKLERQRRRLLLQQHVGVGQPKPAKPKAAGRPRASVALADLGKPVMATAIKEAAEDLAIPPFLDRKDPLIAERMTAARKAAEAEARSRMPLNERAALDLIRGKGNKRKANA